MNPIDLYTSALNALNESSTLLTGKNPFLVKKEESLLTFDEVYEIAMSIDWDEIIGEATSGWSVSTSHHDEHHAKRVSKLNPNSKEHHEAQKDHSFVQNLKKHIETHGPNHTHIQKKIGTKSKESWTDRDGKTLHSDVGKAYQHAGLHHTHVSHEPYHGSEHQKRDAVRTSDKAVHYVVNHKKRQVHILGVGAKQKESDYLDHGVTALKNKLNK